MNDDRCHNCGAHLSLELGYCAICLTEIKKQIEQVFINICMSVKEERSDLEIGDSIIIINKQHPWNEEIGLVCDKRHKFIRIELHGDKIWIPNEWAKKYED